MLLPPDKKPNETRGAAGQGDNPPLVMVIALYVPLGTMLCAFTMSGRLFQHRRYATVRQSGIVHSEHVLFLFSAYRVMLHAKFDALLVVD
jgi:hypothetical protein